MICKNCGNKYDDGYSFCPHCGMKTDTIVTGDSLKHEVPFETECADVFEYYNRCDYRH